MKRKKYNQLLVAIAVFIFAIIVLAITGNDPFLLTAGILTGLLLIVLVRPKVNTRLDEREISIREKAAQLTYSIFAPTIGISAVALLIPSHSGLSVFARGDFAFLESLGMVFAYLTLFLITLYAISHYFIDRQYGGSAENEE